MKGRGNSSAITVNSALKLCINDIVKTKAIQKDKEINYVSKWSNGNEIRIKSVYNDTDIYIQLQYNINNKATKESKAFDYKIYIQKVKSNLGKGYNLYFICPESAIRCKALYLCYNAERFKCRNAYDNRIYYYSQTHSKEYRLNGRYFHLEKTINELYNKRNTTNYNGSPTKRHLRLLRLLDKRIEVDKLRDIQLDNWLCNYYGFNP
jgi:hypothetical protein